VIKTLLLALMFLVPTVAMQSQETVQGDSTGSATAASNQIAVEGCLEGTGGDYWLNAKSGRVYQVEGDTSNLDPHVGHEVQITGSTNGASAFIPSMATEADGMVVRPALIVEHVKHIAEKCNARANY
jgi:hypothetical protein